MLRSMIKIIGLRFSLYRAIIPENVFGADKRASTRVELIKRGSAKQYLFQLTCAGHASNQSVTVYFKFERNRTTRSRDVEAAVCTCARAYWTPTDLCGTPF